MTIVRYNRSEIVSYADLIDEQKAKVLDDFGFNEEEDTMYVYINNVDGSRDALPLSVFQVFNSPIWDGGYPLNMWGGYCIRLNAFSEEALIAERYE